MRNCCNNCSNVSCDKIVDCLNRQWTRFTNGQSNELVNFCESTSKCINTQLLNISLSQSTTLTYFNDALTTYLKTLTGYSSSATLVLTTVADVLQWAVGGGGGGGGGTVTSVEAGKGMDFSTFTTSGSVIMGIPSNITLSSTNSLTTTSHTHAFAPGGTSSQVILGNGTLGSLPTAATASIIFNSTTDWGSPTGGYYSFSFTHNFGTAAISVTIWDVTSTPVQTFPSLIQQTSNNILTIKVTDAPDNRFAGRIVITK